MEKYYTEKDCKCGQNLRMRYEEYRVINAVEGRPGKTDWILEADRGGYFRSGKRWPNYAYCLKCNRRHDLTKFKKWPK